MSRPERHPTKEQMLCEAASIKDRVRQRLNAMLDEAVQAEPAGDLFAELPWSDSSRSGEFEAVLN
jgi:hypothetical protein